MKNMLEDILQYTYYTCYDCSSIHKMYYLYNKKYMCEKCNRIIRAKPPNFKATDEEFNIDWPGIKKYILNSPTPRKALKMFMVKIMDFEYEEYEINHILENLRQKGKFYFDSLTI